MNLHKHNMWLRIFLASLAILGCVWLAWVAFTPVSMIVAITALMRWSLVAVPLYCLLLVLAWEIQQRAQRQLFYYPAAAAVLAGGGLLVLKAANAGNLPLPATVIILSVAASAALSAWGLWRRQD